MGVTNLLMPPDKVKWIPSYHTTPLEFDINGEILVNYRTKADWLPGFTEQFLKSYSDFDEDGAMFHLAEWQKWLLYNVNEVNGDGLLRYRTCLIEVARKNGKTEIAAISVLMHLLTAPDYAEIYSAAADRTQARICFDKVKRWILETPALKPLFHIIDSKSIIVNNKTGTFYRALSADSGKKSQGLNPYFTVIDELHVWDEGGEKAAMSARNYYNALVSASGARAESQVLIITTAGENVNDSILGNLYKKGVSLAKGKDKDDSFGFFCWETPTDVDPLDEKNWHYANPNLAEGLMSIDFFKSSLSQFAALNINSFFRYHLNQWVKTSGEPFVSEFHWERIKNEKNNIGHGRKITAGFDGSHFGDSTGIVIQDYETGVMKVWGVWEKDLNDKDWSVDRDAVEASVKLLMETYDVIVFWADASFWKSDLAVWVKKYNLPKIAIPQTTRMTNFGDDFVKDIVDEKISHTGEEALTRHVLNAIRTVSGKPGKPNGRNKIDLLICAELANAARNFHLSREEYMKNKRKVGVIGVSRF